MFRIKICGITSVDDAHLAIDLGADALGLNFYSGSSRFLALETATEIAREVRSLRSSQAVALVGVFVNETEQKLRETAAAVELDAWQLHGDEPADLVARLSTAPAGCRTVIRAFRCREADLGGVSQRLRECEQAGAWPQAVLLDAYSPAAFGGTGQVVDWHVVREQRDQLFGLPIILAGGLTPENVAEAIRTAQPHGVDVASGVEASPGKKDPVKVRDFIAAARAALDSNRQVI